MRQNPALRPLYHTEAPIRGLFIDRWGTLIDSKLPHMQETMGAWEFQKGALDAMFRAQQAGWLLYLIGNESGVAFGQVDEQCWRDHERELLGRLSAQGVRIQRNYACLDHPAGKGAHKRPSVFLTPDTGVFYHAMQQDEVVLEQSWVIGDGTLELVAGERAGLNSAGVRTGRALCDGELAVDPKLSADDLADFIGALLGPRVGAH
jgi:D-glycero-D-manno-heptose 1,7-bisphosphate phosphatase